MKKQYWKTAVTIVMLTLIMAVCLSMAVYRAASCMALSDEAALLSGKLSFVNGNAQNVTRETFADEKPTEQSVTRPLSETPTAPAETAEKPQDTSHSGDTYPVKALKISNGNMSYDNILIAIRRTSIWTSNLSYRRTCPFLLKTITRYRCLFIIPIPVSGI